MAGSLVCAVHCALLPILVVVLPSVGLSLLLSDRVEQVFVAFASLVGSYALARGFLAHRVVLALALLVPGLVLLWAGILWPPLHHAAVPHAVAMACGGGLVAIAHYLNLRAGRRTAA